MRFHHLMCGRFTTESDTPIPLLPPLGGAEEGIVKTTHLGSKAQRRRRFAGRIALAAGLATLVAVPTSIHGAAADEANVDKEEAQFVTLINQLRVSQGAPELTVNVDLVRVARGWTKKMKEAGDISHNPDLAKQVTANWRKLGENVGVGPTVEILHAAFVKSPAHYRNLVDPAFDQVGITIEYAGDSFYVTEQFMDTDDSKAAPSAAKPPAVPTQQSSAPPQLALKPKAKKPAKKVVVKKAQPTTVPHE
jgi:uncharacterized protein YkwD